MWHAPRQRLPDVAEKGGSGLTSALSEWPWFQHSICATLLFDRHSNRLFCVCCNLCRVCFACDLRSDSSTVTSDRKRGFSTCCQQCRTSACDRVRVIRTWDWVDRTSTSNDLWHEQSTVLSCLHHLNWHYWRQLRHYRCGERAMFHFWCGGFCTTGRCFTSSLWSFFWAPVLSSPSGTDSCKWDDWEHCGKPCCARTGDRSVPFHESPEVQVAERIQEQIVEAIDVTPQQFRCCVQPNPQLEFHVVQHRQSWCTCEHAWLVPSTAHFFLDSDRKHREGNWKGADAGSECVTACTSRLRQCIEMDHSPRHVCGEPVLSLSAAGCIANSAHLWRLRSASRHTSFGFGWPWL